jgi:hypothetical protein
MKISNFRAMVIATGVLILGTAVAAAGAENGIGRFGTANQRGRTVAAAPKSNVPPALLREAVKSEQIIIANPLAERRGGRSSLDDFFLNNHDVDTVVSVVHDSLQQLHFRRGSWNIFNPFNGDTFHIDFITRIYSDSTHIFRHEVEVLAPLGCELDPASPIYNDRLRQAVTAQAIPPNFGSCGITLVPATNSLNLDSLVWQVIFPNMNPLSAGMPHAVVPSGFALGQNFPNPFNSGTTIPFKVPRHAHVSITVHDVAGRLVSTLAEGEFEAGQHALLWNPENLPSGTYFASMREISGDAHSAIQLKLVK